MHGKSTGVFPCEFIIQRGFLCVENDHKCACRCQLAYVIYSALMAPTYIGGLSDEPLLCVEDVFDASDQLQRTAVIRAL